MKDDGVMPPENSRRGFLAFLTCTLGPLPLVGGLCVALRAGLAPAHSDKPPRLPLCRLEEVPEDGILERAVSYEMRRGPAVRSVSRVVLVTRDPKSGDILALLGECTHLGCPVRKRRVENREVAGEALLECPCHGGRFSRTGEVLDGPPRRPLRRLRLDTIPKNPKDMIYLLEV